MPRITAVIVCLLAIVPAAHADKITLKDGGKLEGKVVAESETSLTLEVLIGSKPVKVTVARDRIATHEKSLTQAEEYDALVKKTGTKDADALVALAQWCLDHKMKTEAAEHLKQALLANPKHAGAEAKLKSLGFVKVGEMWMSEEEHKEYQEQNKAGVAAAAPAEGPKPEEVQAEERKAAAAEADRKKLLESVSANLEKMEGKLATTEKSIADANLEINAAEKRSAGLEKQMAELTEKLKQLKASERSMERTSWRRQWNELNDQFGQLEVQNKTQEKIIRENKETRNRLETLQKSYASEVKRLRDRKAEVEAKAAALMAPAPAPPASAPVPVKVDSPPVSVTPVPHPAPPAPVPPAPAAAPATGAPVAAPPAPSPPPPTPSTVTPAMFSAMLDAKAANEFVPWMVKQIKFRNSGHRDVCKFMEGQLVRWTVLSREIGQRAIEFPIVNYDVSKRLLVLEAKVVFTNKAGGILIDSWLEDSEKRRFVHPNALYADYWRRLYTYNYSEVDRYFVEPLTGSTLRRNILLTGGAASRSQTALSLQPGHEICGGLGFFVPEGARNLVLHLSAIVHVEKTVIGGTGGQTMERTEETIRLKIGDIPTGP